ncbi:hypothetical protein QTP86_020378, partial [Hemibagrus guttatus]
MTLAEEKELEIIREGLTYVEEDSHSKSPHWDTSKIGKVRSFEGGVLEEDSYVDDILTSITYINDQEILTMIINGLEETLTAGGFALKPWVRSGQSGRQVSAVQTQGQVIMLPNQLKVEEQ